MTMEIAIAGRWPTALDQAAVSKMVADAYRRTGGSGSVILNLSFVDDRAIRKLNREWRGVDQPTDVLSFGQKGFVSVGGRGRRPVRALGDVVISLPTARRQAKAAGRDLSTELASLIVHGALHLCGMDHASMAGERRMFALQQELLLCHKFC